MPSIKYKVESCISKLSTINQYKVININTKYIESHIDTEHENLKFEKQSTDPDVAEDDNDNDYID